MTEELNVVPWIKLREGNARRTEQTEEILPRGAIPKLLPLFPDQLRGNLMRILPVFSKVHHSRAFAFVNNPGGETCRSPLKGIQHE